LIATDARFSTWYIAKWVGVSVGATHTVLRNGLKTHLLKKKQKLARVRISKQLLKQFSKYNNWFFANIITGDETYMG
jgi:hypothetical protein